MSFSPVHIDQASYFGKDLADVDQVIWLPEMRGCPALAPTGNFISDLDALLHNRSPRSGKKVRPRDGKMYAAQCVLTSPKCISVLELCGVDPRLSTVVTQSVCACLETVSLLAAAEGKQPDGQKKCCLAAFANMQRLTAFGLPHRHGHLVVLSLCYNPEKQRVTYANLSRVCIADVLLQSLFHHGLAWGASRLGYGIVKRGESFSVDGFPEELVDLLGSGPRGKKGIPKRARPAAQFDPLKESWLAVIGSEGRHTLEALPSRTPAPPSDFAEEFVSSVREQLRGEFHAPAVNLAAKALQDTLGRMPADLSIIAGFVLGRLPPGLDRVRSFSLGKYICVADKDGLAEERDFFRFLRGLRPAKTTWCKGSASVGWWAEPLNVNRDRVAILRGRFEAKDVELLKVELSRQDNMTLVIPPSDQLRLRTKASEIRAHLRRGGRVLFLGDPGHSAGSVWLDHLPRDTGIRVWHRASVEAALEINSGAGLPIKLHCGSSIEIFAHQYAHRPGALFLCSAAELASMNQEVRKRRKGLSRRPGDVVTRTALVKVNDAVKAPNEIHPGQYVQFKRGAPAGETMLVLAVNRGGITVERAKIGLREVIRAKSLSRLAVFDRVEREVAVGERLRIVRNGPKANVTGLRNGRRFEVRKVEKDGTLHLGTTRVMPPDCWHWEYDYCAATEGPAMPAHTLVVAAEDVKTVNAGWLRPGVCLRVCAPTQESGEEAVRAAFPDGDDEHLYLLGTADISVNEAQEFDLDQAGSIAGDQDVNAVEPTVPEQNSSGPPQPNNQAF